MKIPTIKGIIERRILANFTVEPGIIQKIIPQPLLQKFITAKQWLVLA
jgi:hypothetical protein